VLTDAWTWRATFYILSVLGSILFIAFLLFKDTFRRERSLAYQSAVVRLRSRRRAKEKSAAPITNDTGKATSAENKNQEETGPEIQEIGKGGQQPSLVNEKNCPEGSESVKDIKLSLADVNPFPQVVQIMMRKNNIVIYFPSGETCCCSL
jgi:hypothetical protein